MFLVALAPVLVLSAVMIVRLRHLEKHDRVLYRFCEVRRKMMHLLRDSGTELSPGDYAALRAMLDIIGRTIHDYHETKERLLDGRRILRFVSTYNSTVGAVDRLAGEIEDRRVVELRTEFGRAVLFGFLQYTPLLRSELSARVIIASVSLFARLGWSRMKNLAAPLAAARDTAVRQGQEFGYAH